MILIAKTITVVAIILVGIIMWLSLFDKKFNSNKTISILVVFLLSILLIITVGQKAEIIDLSTPNNSCTETTKTENQTTISNIKNMQQHQSEQNEQKTVSEPIKTEESKKLSSANQQNQQSICPKTQKTKTEEIIDQVNNKKKYIIIPNQYKQSMNDFLKNHGYEKVATTPDGNLYEYKRTQFGFR